MLTPLQIFHYYAGSSRTEMQLYVYMFLHWQRNLHIQPFACVAPEGLQVRGLAKR